MMEQGNTGHPATWPAAGTPVGSQIAHRVVLEGGEESPRVLADTATPPDMFVEMLLAQHRLQVLSMKDGDPMLLTGEALMHFVTWNVFAVEDELHEAIAETDWKPWSSGSNAVNNPTAYTKELVDAWHFFMNLMMIGAAANNVTLVEYAGDFHRAYMAKNAINAERMERGYDGSKVGGEKCPECGRAFEDTVKAQHCVCKDGTTVCSPTCVHTHMQRIAAARNA